ncbi:radical SAM protein [Ilyobacter polytropus]|uniref:Radical SAM domain protein n=1 Tax=Ilyobacter polytropus (strain ATCC 51220 / DSM 2926 / LMG 16218 / CuHBu1) TaxID=572544 RepID=E3HBP3_ILYPC|nr:radical SAM protein [Ilyobacter polytropus]ADO83805.1 Radical SAM domain protein [Ilyobacter polytropus DSM 2926]
MEENVLHLELILTMECNANCDYCYQNGAEKVPDMDEEFIDKLYEKIKSEEYYNKFVIALFGGEPTLAEDKILYLLEKLENLKDSKVFRFTMPTNAIDTDAVLRIKKAINKRGWEVSFTLSNKEDLTLSNIPDEILIESSYSFIFNSSNYTSITEDLIDTLKNSKLGGGIVIKPDVYSDLSSIPASDVSNILKLVADKKAFFNVNLTNPDATACVMDDLERVTVFSTGEFAMCTRMTMGCYEDGYIGHIDTTTFQEAVANRIELASQISETGMCLCKTQAAIESANYVDEIIQATDGIYDGLVVAKD